MGERAGDDSVCEEQAGGSGARVAVAAAVAIAVLAALLQLYRVDDGLRGFLAFNEGFYMLNGVKDVSRGILSPLVAPLDANNPWVYPLLLSWTLRAFGKSIAVARTLSIVASAASVLLTFGIGRRLYNDAAGLVGAALFAFSPGQAIVGRNIQTDAVMLAFVLAAVYCYLRAQEGEDVRWSVAAGVALALGTMTKLPAVLVLPALALWQTWRTGAVAWVGARATRATALTFAIAVVPWYAYRAFASTAFRDAQGYLFGTGGWRGIGFLYRAVLVQSFWMLSPVFALCALAAVIRLARVRRPPDELVLSFVAVYAVFFLFYNYHVYYYLPIVPWLALAVGAGAGSLVGRHPGRALAVAALLVVLVVPFTLVGLAAKKYSPTAPGDVVLALRDAGYRPADVRLVIDRKVWGDVGPAIAFAAQEAGAAAPQPDDGTTPDAKGKAVVVIADRDLTERGAKFVGQLQDEWIAPVAFGYAVRDDPGKCHFFHPARLQFERVGPPWAFGWSSKTVPSPYSAWRIEP